MPPTSRNQVGPGQSTNSELFDASNPQMSKTVERSHQELREQAIEAQEAGQFDEAVRLFRELLLADPADHEILFHLANTYAEQGELANAIDLLSEIPAEDPDAGIPSLGVSAEWCMRLERYDDAESRYRRILKVDPTVQVARRQLAHLLNRQGRRHEAVGLVRQLCLAGDVTQGELHSLIVQCDAMYDAPGSTGDGVSEPYWPIGPMGQARFAFTESRFREAVELMRPAMLKAEPKDAEIAFYGRAVAEAQDISELANWKTRVTESVKEHPDYWAALGIYLIGEAKFQEAVAALGEAIRLDPTDFRSMRRLFQAFRSLNDENKSIAWIDRYDVMKRMVRLSNLIGDAERPDPQWFKNMAAEMESVGRNLESILWSSVAAAYQNNGQQTAANLSRKMRQVIADQEAFPDRNQVWCQMDLVANPLPSFPDNFHSLAATTQTNSQDASNPMPSVIDTASFRDVTGEVGLRHTYRISTDRIEKAFAIYQSVGGGVAVIDFDLDGWQDFLLAQGAADPPDFVAKESDQLLRTVQTNHRLGLVNVTNSAGCTDKNYTIGVTAGDWNQDGLPDLAVANLGTNRLLINQGDGTFRVRPLDERADYTLMSTSMAMGDVTGDSLPDLFSLNYLRDPELFKRPELDAAGNPLDAIGPLTLKTTRDNLYVNNDHGESLSTLVGADDKSACTGLGVVLTSLLNGRQGNQVFIANDVRNNQLWVRDSANEMVDVAVPLGCAYGSLGAATAAMGVASADFDGNGAIDLHVTNFIDEPVSLFMGSDDLFRDLHYRFNLAEASTNVLGFGTQALDYSNDGRPDIVVTNGHVEDLSARGQPFRMPLQLFSNQGNRFELVDMEGSETFSKPRLGRALARLDFDRNGAEDFIVTDMLDSTALVVNETATSNHWVSLILVGTTSERDAIGAKIEVFAGQEKQTGWVTAGDGFLCKNESALHFGLGKQSAITRVVVTWPTKKEQTFDSIMVDHSNLLIEDQATAFTFNSGGHN
jgi:tetratricopeptide (TPR) repeat protein